MSEESRRVADYFVICGTPPAGNSQDHIRGKRQGQTGASQAGEAPAAQDVHRRAGGFAVPHSVSLLFLFPAKYNVNAC